MFRRLSSTKITDKLHRIKEQGSMILELFRLDSTLSMRYVQMFDQIDKVLGKNIRDAITEMFRRLIHNHDNIHTNSIDIKEGIRSILDSLPTHITSMSNWNRIRMMKFMLVWVEKINSLSVVLQLWKQLPRLVEQYDDAQLQEYLTQVQQISIENHSKALAILSQTISTAKEIDQQIQPKLWLEDIQAELLLYAQAHCGDWSGVRIQITDKDAFTDGRNIYLPRFIEGNIAKNRERYTILTALQAGYIEFETLNFILEDVFSIVPVAREQETDMERLFRGFQNSSLAKELFFLIEQYRVSHLVGRQYPGIADAVQEYLYEIWFAQKDLAQPTEIRRVVRDFGWMLFASTDEKRHAMAVWAQTLVVDTFAPFFVQPSTLPSVYTTISLLQRIYQRVYTLMGNNPYPLLFAGAVVMGVDTSAWSIDAIEEEKQAKQQSKREQISLYRSLQEQRTKKEKQAELLLDKTAIDIHNAGPVQTKESSNAKYKPWKASDISVLSSEHFQYPEWDCHVGNYRGNWTTVREFIVQANVGAGDMGVAFATETAQQYAMEISMLQRRFQAIQAQRFQRVVGAYDGDDIDLSKWMEFYVQKKSGLALDSNLYTQHKKMHRDIAVGLLMDLSSSTNEITEKSKRIVDIEKEAIFVLAEALQSVGDKFAVYAWSGYSRHNVEFYVAKEPQEPWNQESKSRLGQLYWNAENRDGTAIRHCVQKMRSWSAQKKILFVVSDGRPSDGGCPDYHDVYAQEDTKQALIEAKKQGIHSFCVTVDPYGQEYLESMFGVGNFIVIEDIASLPEKIGRLYYSLSVGR